MKTTMKAMTQRLLAVALLCGSAMPALAQVSFSLGVNLPLRPRLLQVPGDAVYYAPQVDSNYFFYGGRYWVYADDNWYTARGYNGPWYSVAPQQVPPPVLRVPVRYYRAPPSYFEGWRLDAPPRWGQHWGPQWEQQHRGWDRQDARPPQAERGRGGSQPDNRDNGPGHSRGNYGGDHHGGQGQGDRPGQGQGRGDSGNSGDRHRDPGGQPGRGASPDHGN